MFCIGLDQNLNRWIWPIKPTGGVFLLRIGQEPHLYLAALHPQEMHTISTKNTHLKYHTYDHWKWKTSKVVTSSSCNRWKSWVEISHYKIYTCTQIQSSELMNVTHGLQLVSVLDANRCSILASGLRLGDGPGYATLVMHVVFSQQVPKTIQSSGLKTDRLIIDIHNQGLLRLLQNLKTYGKWFEGWLGTAYAPEWCW